MYSRSRSSTRNMVGWDMVRLCQTAPTDRFRTHCSDLSESPPYQRSRLLQHGVLVHFSKKQMGFCNQFLAEAVINSVRICDFSFALILLLPCFRSEYQDRRRATFTYIRFIY